MIKDNTILVVMKRRILQVLPALNVGGVEAGTVHTAIALKRGGFVPFVASSGGVKVKDLNQEHIQHFTLWLNSKNPLIILLNVFLLCGLILLKRIDIVHAGSRAPAWSAYLACRLTGCTYVTTFHGFYKCENRVKKAYNRVMTYGQKVIVSTEFMKDYVCLTYACPPEKVIVIPRGIETDIFHPDKVSVERKEVLREKYDLSVESIIVTLPGRLTDWKGQKVFLAAASEISKRYQHIKYFFIMAGTGTEKYKKELYNIIEKSKLPVYIDETCTDIPALYQLSDIIISTSTENETFGRVAVEGQAAGKLVIATNIGGSCETVEEKSGILIPPGDVSSLVDAILTGKAYPEQAIINSKKYDISVFNQNIITFYTNL
jgi:glycosyltransferase involved in cell wall biosynthesis